MTSRRPRLQQTNALLLEFATPLVVGVVVGIAVDGSVLGSGVPLVKRELKSSGVGLGVASSRVDVIVVIDVGDVSSDDVAAVLEQTLLQFAMYGWHIFNEKNRKIFLSMIFFKSALNIQTT